MDRRRLIWALLAGIAAAVLLFLYANKPQASGPGSEGQGPGQTPAADTRPASGQPSAAQTRAAEAIEAGQPAQARAEAPAPPASRPVETPAIGSAPSSPEAEAPLAWFGPQVAEISKHTIGSLEEEDGYAFQVELTNEGAAINTLKMARYFATVDDKRLHQSDPKEYEQAQRRDPGKYKGHYSLMNPVSHGGRRHLPLATAGLVIRLQDGKDALLLNLDRLSAEPWRLVEKTPESITFAYDLYRGRDEAEARSNPFLRITKTYAVRKGDYSVGVSLNVENLSGLALKIDLDQRGPTGLPREDLRADHRQAPYGKVQPSDQRVQVTLKPNGELAKWKLGATNPLGSSDDERAVLWLGHINKFFGAMMYLQPEQPEDLANPDLRAQFYLAAAEESDTARTFLTGVKVPGLALAAGQSRQIAFDLFAGPKKRDFFSDKHARHYKPLYQRLSYIGTIDFGASCFCTFSWLTLGMMWMLEKLSVLALGNYGVAIILLVMLVRLALHPLTKRSQVSMMRMQKLAPEMQKLKEKHAGDKDALNREMMKLYKQQGAGPLMGCLPMFLQMPIWIALWTALNAAVELRHAAFLPVWITDLAAPDALVSWSAPVTIPLVSGMVGPIASFNLLPILLTVAMFFQSKLTPQAAQAAASPEQASQQKMMKYMMPAMMLLIFYPAPSGLTLYIMTSTFAGVAEQIVIKRHIQARQAAEAAAETMVALPGKAPRGKRPKKPKGPLWFKKG